MQSGVQSSRFYFIDLRGFGAGIVKKIALSWTNYLPSGMPTPVPGTFMLLGTPTRRGRRSEATNLPKLCNGVHRWGTLLSRASQFQRENPNRNWPIKCHIAV
jgi:hypothetical protein